MICRMIFAILSLLFPTQRSGNPCVFHLESLNYNPLARQARIQGKVQVLVTVSSDGRVVSARAGSGHRLLRQEAENNVQKWVFSPGEERTFEVSYEFRLEEPDIYYEPHSRVTFDLPERVLVVSNFQTIDH